MNYKKRERRIRSFVLVFKPKPGHFDWMDKQSYLENLSDTLFWDVKRDSVDPHEHRRFLIARVMDYGTRADVRLTEAFYTADEILSALLMARSLHKKTLSYFSAVFQVPREQFRAWNPNEDRTWTQ